MQPILLPGVSDAELKRRWKLVREKMREQGIDYLVARNGEIYMGGVVRWLTDFNGRHQNALTVIFPREDEMTTIACGADPAFGLDNWPYAWATRGVKQRLGHVYFPTVPANDRYDAELAVSVLKEKPDAVIGLVETAFIPKPFYDTLREGLPKATFVDASELVHELIAIKSEEEISYICEAADLGDRLLAELPEIVRPGKREIDIYADIHYFLDKNGSERAIVGIGSGPQGAPVPFIDDPHFQGRTVEKGDIVAILLEFTGPHGYYVEAHRPVVLGEPIPALQKAFDTAVKLQHEIADRLVDGAVVTDVYEYFCRRVKEEGYGLPNRSFSHAQGLSFLERPNVRPDEPWTMKENMHMVIHPGCGCPDALAMVFDNYLIGKGPAQRLSRYPQEIIIAE